MSKVIAYVKALKKLLNRKFLKKMNEVYTFYSVSNVEDIKKYKLYWDMSCESVRSLTMPDEYCQYDFYRKSAEEKRAYISYRESVDFSKRESKPLPSK